MTNTYGMQTLVRRPTPMHMSASFAGFGERMGTDKKTKLFVDIITLASGTSTVASIKVGHMIGDLTCHQNGAENFWLYTHLKFIGCGVFTAISSGESITITVIDNNQTFVENEQTFWNGKNDTMHEKEEVDDEEVQRLFWDNFDDLSSHEKKKEENSLFLDNLDDDSNAPDGPVDDDEEEILLIGLLTFPILA